MPGAFGSSWGSSWGSAWGEVAASAAVVEGKYARQHAQALRQVTKAGSAVTFTRSSSELLDGVAMQVRGDPQRYRDNGLVLSTMPTLLFVPSEYPLLAFSEDFVRPGDFVPWRGVAYVVRDVDPIAPDGTVIAARIIIGV